MGLDTRGDDDGVSADELRLARAVLDGIVAVGPAGAPVPSVDAPVPLAGSDELVATLSRARERLGRLLERVDVQAPGLTLPQQADQRSAPGAASGGSAPRRTASASG